MEQFQPLEKVPLERYGWVIVDLAIAVGLVVSIFVMKSKSNKVR